MAKIKSVDQLEDLIDKEMAYRRIEIFHLMAILKAKRQSSESIVLTKALVLIAYSHWEGFVKIVSQKYLEYIIYLGYDVSRLSPELSSSFLFNTLCSSQKTTHEKILAITEVLTNPNYKHQINHKTLIDAKSNLNSEVLKDIVNNIGLDWTDYDNFFLYLDNVILKHRNDFAHGDNGRIDVDDAIDIAETSLKLMGMHKTLIENAISLRSYMKQPHA